MRKWVVAGGAALVVAAFAARGCVASRPKPPTVTVVRTEPEPEPEPPPPPPPAPPPAPAVAPPAPPPPTPPAPAAPAPGTGSVIGTVRLAGQARIPKPVRMDADPKCAARHAVPPLRDDLVVDRESRVRWAFVHVKRGLNERRYPPPGTPVFLEQVGCVYRPHVFGIQAGQTLVIRNGDDLLHNVHALPAYNREFNFGQPEAGMEETVRFAVPEVMVPIRCDVHPWMSAWAGVVDHPFFAVTDELGGYAITGLPPGRLVVETWHERLAPERREVDVPEGGQAAADFLLRMKSDSR